MDSSKQLAYKDLNWAIGINRVALKILGLWPDSKATRQQEFFANLRFTVIFITMMSAAVVPGMFAMVVVWGDMLAITDNLQIALPFSVSVMKFVIMWFRKQDLIPVMDIVIADWMREKTRFERETMIKQARIAKYIVIFGCCMMTFACFVLIVPPAFGYTMRYLTNITDPGRPLLVQTYFLRETKDTPYYEIAFASQAAAICMAAICYTGIDSFLNLLVFHICAQLDILRERVLNMNSFKDFYAGISYNAKDHLRIIRFVDVIESTFNLMLLALLVYFSILFCVQGFLLINIIDGNDEVSFMRICWLASILINTFLHMCLYCVVGEILITKCEAVYYAMYDFKWYKLKPHEAKTLLLMMMRAEKPLYITAGGMFPMTLSMFCSLIKTSAGYISVLLTQR